jgi:3-phenylpropionate/trans-cinnamate dioxygenase ferredoxin subunit
VKFELFPEGDLRPGDLREVVVEGVSIVLLRKADGSFRALRNRCSHQGGKLSDGRLEPMLDASAPGQFHYAPGREVLRCPLHQFEFDVDSGLSPADPQRVRVASYEVTVEQGTVCLRR